MSETGRWSFWIDRGGTFTDVVARDPEGTVHVRKLLSEDPARYADAPLAAMRALLEQPQGPLTAERIESIRMGTTVATNALLERRGTPVALVITAGFEDLLEIGTQDRPELFALRIEKPTPLTARVVGVAERIDAAGRVHRAPNLVRVRSELEALRAEGIDSVAVVLAHAYLNPVHEQAVGELARELGFAHVGLSHEVVREINLTGRGDTTTADAYLTPILRDYVDRLRAHLDRDVPLRFMQSSGGLADADRFRGKDAILSGPAGGVVAARAVATQTGLRKVIGFDMGGTSTDVCRIDVVEGPDRTYETVMAGVRIKAPMLNIATIAAGGGSLLTFDGRRLQVGPASAGADPGPVCYRRAGGKLAVTDANAVLGRVQPEFFPSCFGAEGDAPLDVDAARAALEALRARTPLATVEELAAGFVRIANDNMARAIREISVARGYDVTDYGLVCFGGAAAQHACAIADSLGIQRVVVHPHGGVLSAYGIGLADVTHTAVEAVLTPFDQAGEQELEEAYERLERAGTKALKAQGVKPKRLHHVRAADLRYAGVDATITVAAPTRDSTLDWEGAFARAHERLYGFDRPGHALEIVNARVESIGAPRPKKRARKRPPELEPVSPGEPAATVEVWFDLLGSDGVRTLGPRATPVFRREALSPGATVAGPAIVAEAVSTVVVDPGWSARVDTHGNLVIEAAVEAQEGGDAPAEIEGDPEMVEAFEELTRSMVDELASVGADELELLVGQGEGFGLGLSTCTAVIQKVARETGTAVTLPSGGDPLAGADPEMLEAFEELTRSMVDELEAVGPTELAMLVEQGEGFGLEVAACEAVIRKVGRETGTSVPRAGGDGGPAEQVSIEPDPITLEIMGNLYMSIAEQMGATLRRVSLSVNIKERLDFSCAVFDRDGRLVANAPHIPVHLGAMSESVRAVLESRGDDLRAGDVLVTNDPYHGGSHLPDITVVTPVFLRGGRTFVVASRGHHADVGGVVPGSMPPFSRSIEDEGVRLHDVLAVREGEFRAEELRALLAAGPHPVRGIDDRLADLEAQIAANARGVRLLTEMVDRYGLEAVGAYMGHVQADAAAAMREAIAALPDGAAGFVDHLDDGARIAVTITVTGDRAVVDFTGTDPVLPGNLNAPQAVVRAAVLYVFRTLVARPIPLNSGCFAPLEIVIPAGSLLDPAPPAAVVGGNVETSQRIVDVLYGALGKLGAAQGTMNNVTFGGADSGYYETIGGGAGAGLGFDGASAVHTHMTNTRITDPEVLERRHPVRVRRFGIRRGSGGDGVWRGGDGVVRALEFLAPRDVAVLSERRGVRPYGAHGAGPGAVGKNQLTRGGIVRDLPGKVRLEAEPGDVLTVSTPGGGGYDPSPAEWAALPPSEARALFRAGRYRGPTSGIALGFVQANLVVLPAAQADAFETYCRQNPGPCPLLERLAPGDPISQRLAPGADLRVDLPRYRVHTATGSRDVADLTTRWRDDSVAFLLGCSFSAEDALLEAGIGVRHIEERKNVPMFRTDRRTRRVGPFRGSLVVTMRPLDRAQTKLATRVTEPAWYAHGGPVHVGDHEAIGIADLQQPDWGDAVGVRYGEVPVFWACGVTSQEAIAGALAAGAVDEVLTHAPGHMFIADVTGAELERGD